MQMNKVLCAVEKRIIPTYVPDAPEKMPYYEEFRQYQGSSGRTYPNRVVFNFPREEMTDQEYTVIRMENNYLRIVLLPEIGGRIWEGYDKVNDYYFIFRAPCIKPVAVSSAGPFIGGGMEFNTPFFHKISTFMPYDWDTEYLDDGSAITWMSESAPSPGQYRFKVTYGIKLYPDKSYFETVVKLDNRTPIKHPFLWWESCGVPINDNYQLFYPQDVGYVHHHNDRHHTTFPIAKGYYAVEEHKEATDISLVRNSQKGNSYFAGPSKYDFFGGYDLEKQCGTMHIGDHHITRGRKIFVWGNEELADAWNTNMASLDNKFGEIMAGSFVDDQPDFSVIAPYEVKKFSQFWYPFAGTGLPTYANLDAVVTLDKASDKVRVAVTAGVKDARLIVDCAGKVLLDETIHLMPSEYLEFDAKFIEGDCHILFTDRDGKVLAEYTEDKVEVLHIPQDNTGIPTPKQLKTAQDIFQAGYHIYQYRDPGWKAREYYEEALKKEPNFLPALIEIAEACYAQGHYEEALDYVRRAEQVLNRYNPNNYDGTCNYIKGLCLYGQGSYDAAYEVFYNASCSFNTVSPAMTFLAAIDGRRGNYAAMKEHAQKALEREADHAICRNYLAMALYKLGCKDSALEILKETLDTYNIMDHFARFLLLLYSGKDMDEFYQGLFADPAETCLDIAFNLLDAGFHDEAATILKGLEEMGKASAMSAYTLAYIYDLNKEYSKAQEQRKLAAADPYVRVFPARLEEMNVLKAAVLADPADYVAWYLYGCILYDNGFDEEAAAAQENAIAANPDFYIPYRNLAIIYYSALNRKEEALQLLRKACEVNPREDAVVRETVKLMAKMGVDDQERLKFAIENMPEHPSDTMTWELANAYNAAQEFDKSMATMLGHKFLAAEMQETCITEPWTFAQCAKGRILQKEGRIQEALECFQNAQKLPENFHAGWWDKQSLYYAYIYEAKALMELGRTEEAKAAAGRLLPFVHSGYSPYMGLESDVFVAEAYRLIGDEVTAVTYISKYIDFWEKELFDDRDRKPVITAVHDSYRPDGVTEYRASVLLALGYSRLFFGDKEKAAEYFRKSLALNPENNKPRFELAFMNGAD